MSFLGRAVIASWSETHSDEIADVRAWHTREHIPERLSLPGFLRVRRYHAADDPNALFILYEAETLDALHSPDYLERLDHPTPWTRANISRLRRATRGVCHVLRSECLGVTGIAGTLRFADVPDIQPKTWDAALGAPGITGLHLCRADTDASTIPTAERALRTVASPAWIAIVEGLTPEDVSREMQRLCRDTPATGVIARLWQCELVVTREEVAACNR